jgi:hypothetical protein
MTTTTADEPVFLTADEVAELFGRDSSGKLRISKRSVYRHWKAIPGAIRLGTKLLFRRGPLMAWAADVQAGTVIPFARKAV